MEIWKPIPGFESTYEVSNLGRVKSYAQSAAGKLRAPLTNLRGYKQMILSKAGKNSIHSVHLLVCQAFIGQKPAGMEINHKNGIKADNRLENLEYCTKSENKSHSVNVLKQGRGESHGMSKINEEIVREIRRLAATKMCHREIAAKFGITRPNVSYIVKGVAWRHIT